MNNRIEYLVEEFFNKFFPDLADKVHQEQSDWLRYAIITIAEEARREERERRVRRRMLTPCCRLAGSTVDMPAEDGTWTRATSGTW